jgi:hypothetical protein
MIGDFGCPVSPCCCPLALALRLFELILVLL